MVVFDEILVAVDEGVAEVGVDLEDFLETTVYKSTHQWTIILSIIFFNNSILDVLLWFTHIHLHEVIIFFIFECLEIIGLLRPLMALD